MQLFTNLCFELAILCPMHMLNSNTAIAEITASQFWLKIRNRLFDSQVLEYIPKELSSSERQ